jgi:hypothetical protein
MATLDEANNARQELKTKYSIYSWYSATSVTPDENGYYLTISVKRINPFIRQIIPESYNGVKIKTELII